MKKPKALIKYLRGLFWFPQKYNRERKTIEGFKRSLYEEAVEIANEELNKEMLFGEYLDDLIEKVMVGDEITDEEALSVGMLRIKSSSD